MGVAPRPSAGSLTRYGPPMRVVGARDAPRFTAGRAVHAAPLITKIRQCPLEAAPGLTGAPPQPIAHRMAACRRVGRPCPPITVAGRLEPSSFSSPFGPIC